jgi:hypothetical protein
VALSRMVVCHDLLQNASIQLTRKTAGPINPAFAGDVQVG